MSHDEDIRREIDEDECTCRCETCEGRGVHARWYCVEDAREGASRGCLWPQGGRYRAE